MRRINIKTAIELVWRGINFISSYLPLDIIKDLRDYVIDDFDAYNKIDQVFKTSFLPNKENAKKTFHNFIRKKVLKELNKIYLKIIKTQNYRDKVLRMIGFARYSEIFNNSTALHSFKMKDLRRDSLQELQLEFKNYVSEKITEIIKNQEFENINLSIIKIFPTFKKWTAKIIYELKNQLERTTILKIDKKTFDIRNLLNNHYGRLITKDIVETKFKNKTILQDQEVLIDENDLIKLVENFKFLNLKQPKISNKTS
jgi:hypothetical protein